MQRRAIGTILLILPIMAACLWLISGRETLTKSNKVVGVPVKDELFDDTFIQQKMVRGPIFGYYIGLDVVLGVTAICLALWLIVWWITRHRPGMTRNTR